MNGTPKPPVKRSYQWPWIALAAAVAAILLAVIWMSREVERTRRIRDANIPTPANATSPPSNPR